MPANKFFKLWLEIHSSMWFVPSIMVLGAVGLAAGLTALDIQMGSAMTDRWEFLAISGEGARGIFSSVATSMITVAGVIYSITIVSMTLAANQYSPRVLRTFMNDRGNQVVLGYFTGMFAFSLVLLRTIRSGENDVEFVPTITALTGIVLAVMSVGFLIYFINHVAESIQASFVIATVARATTDRIEKLLPPRNGQPVSPGEGATADRDGDWRPIPADDTGYIQSIATDGIVEAARAHGTVVRMDFPIGGFVSKGAPLAQSLGEPSPELVRKVNQAVAVDHFRTLDQDPAYGIRLIVDVALKALSPSLNDSTTAVTCVNYLTAILTRLAGRQFPPCERYKDGVLCAVVREASFESALNLAYHEIRQNSRGNISVILAQLEGLEALEQALPERESRLLLWKHAEWIAESASRAVESPHDRAVIEERVLRFSAAMRKDP